MNRPPASYPSVSCTEPYLTLDQNNQTNFTKRKRDIYEENNNQRKKLKKERIKQRRSVADDASREKQKHADKERKECSRSLADHESREKQKEKEKARFAILRSNEKETVREKRLKTNKNNMSTKRRNDKKYQGECASDDLIPLIIGLPNISCLYCDALLFENESGRSKHACCHKRKK